MTKLQRIAIRGYKSIKDCELELRNLNVLVGANGSGKSNFISCFHLLSEMAEGRLQQAIRKSGGAAGLLHYGPKETEKIEADLDFESEDEPTSFRFRLSHAPVDTLMVEQAEVKCTPPEFGFPGDIKQSIPSLEWQLAECGKNIPFREIQFSEYVKTIRGCRDYRFHDTAPNARIRQSCYIESGRALLPDAGNLAAVLYRLKKSNIKAYKRIVGTLRQIAPFFDDFILEPSVENDKNVLLTWREVGSDLVFGPHQISDGTLRAMALVTLLMQPAEDIPGLLAIDEPELGLHPTAMAIIAALIQSVATRSQVIVATQSMALIDHFAAEDIVVADRKQRGTTFERLSPEDLSEWLKEFSVSQLWEKNVIGGTPTPWYD